MDEKHERSEFILALYELGVSKDTIIATMALLPTHQDLQQMGGYLARKVELGEEITNNTVLSYLTEILDGVVIDTEE